jgi:hypothetical protein
MVARVWVMTESLRLAGRGRPGKKLRKETTTKKSTLPPAITVTGKSDGTENFLRFEYQAAM